MDRKLSLYIISEPIRWELQQNKQCLRQSSFCVLALAVMLMAQLVWPAVPWAQTQASPSTFWSVQFFTPDNGWLDGSGRLLHTGDGGQN